MKTHLYSIGLQAYNNLKKNDGLDPDGLYLTALPSGGFTLFLGPKPFELYTPEP